jgi:predicted RNA binding protein YcfA (HicA-like mRNA interferase family)
MAESASAIPKDLRPLVKLARKQGWTFERTNGGHFCFTDPQGGRWIAPGTSSDMRGIRNTRAMLVRGGLVIG